MSLTSLCTAAGRKAIEQVPISLWRRLMPRDVFAWYYHMISDQALPHAAPIGRYKDDVQFDADLEFLKRAGTVMHYDQVHQHRLHSQPVPPRAFHISFDDGFRECFDVARPVLLRHGLSAAFFVATDFIDNRELMWVHRVAVCIDRAVRAAAEDVAAAIQGLNTRFNLSLDRRAALVTWLRGLKQTQQDEIGAACELLGVDVPAYLSYHRPYLTVEQIKQMAAEGFTIGAHSTKHHILGEMNDPREIETEIVESCRIIREITGAAQVPFAFPFHGVGVDRELLADIRRRHDFVGLIFDTQKLVADERFIVQRVPSDSTARAAPGASNLPYLMVRAYLKHKKLM